MVYIDQDVALEALDKSCDRLCPYPKKQRAIMCGYCAMGDAICIIEGLAAADVRENVKGEWIKDSDSVTVCSECATEMPTLWSQGKLPKRLVRYCYFCGADMRKTCDGDSCPL